MRTGTKECDIYTIIIEKHEAKEFHNAVNDSRLQITVYMQRLFPQTHSKTLP